MRIPNRGGAIQDMMHEEAGLQVPTWEWDGTWEGAACCYLTLPPPLPERHVESTFTCSRAAVRTATLYHRAGGHAAQAMCRLQMLRLP